LALLYGQSRIFYAMARDGLLPAAFAKVHPRRRTPWVGTLITAVVVGILGGLLPIGVLGELGSVGTLMAVVLICGAVRVLRVRHPEMHRGFKTPLWQVTAPLGIASCVYLICQLPSATLVRMMAWLLVGLVVYFLYVHRRNERVVPIAAEAQQRQP